MMPTPMISLHDALCDSPLYRTSSIHFDNQLLSFEKWLQGLAQQWTSYTALLTSVQQETSRLWPGLTPSDSVDGALLDGQVTGMMVHQVTEAFENNLSFQAKLVVSLESQYIKPLQQFVESRFAEFKALRQRQLTMRKEYERHLTSHAAMQKGNGSETIAAVLAQQVKMSRANYTKLCGDHALQVLRLRSDLHHLLLQQFHTCVQSCHIQIEAITSIHQRLRSLLASWGQWIIDDKNTCQFEWEQKKIALPTLEQKALQYQQGQMTNHWKCGYLFVPSTTGSEWQRQWFFAHDGYFGACQLINADDSVLTLDYCHSLASCDVRAIDHAERRFCFELTVTNDNDATTTLMLQGETDHERQQWMDMIMHQQGKALDRQSVSEKRYSNISIVGDMTRTSALVVAKSRSTTGVSTPMDIPVTLSSTNNNNSTISGLSNLSTSPATIHSTASNANKQPSSAVAAAATSDTIHTTAMGIDHSFIPAFLNHLTATRSPARLWAQPRSLLLLPPPRAMVQDDACASSSSQQHAHGRTVWPIALSTPATADTAPMSPIRSSPGTSPTAHDACQVPSKNKVLRRLFYGVSPQELVLEAFTASLHRMAPIVASDAESDHDQTSSSHAYYGHVFLTQEHFWFYSHLMVDSLQTMVFKLHEIQDVQYHSPHQLHLSLVDNQPTVVLSVYHTQHIDALVDRIRLLLTRANKSMEMQASFDQFNRLCTVQVPMPTADANVCEEITSTTVNQPPRPKKVKKARIPAPDPDALPAHITAPTEPVVCACDDHLDRLDVEMELPVSAKRLFELMFSDEANAPPTAGGVWNKKTEAIQGHDLRVTTWANSNDNQLTRTLKYWMPVANPIVRMKEAEVVETQVLLKKDEHLCYVVQISTRTEALPYADAFIPSVRYCITYIDKSRCKLACYLGVRWTKFVMTKMIVTKAALKGMSDSVGVFVPILQASTDEIKLTVDNLRTANDRQALQDEDDESDAEQTDAAPAEVDAAASGTPEIAAAAPPSPSLPAPAASEPNKRDVAPVTAQEAAPASATPRPEMPATPIPSSTSTSTTFISSDASTTTKSAKIDDDDNLDDQTLVQAACASLWPPRVSSTWAIIVLACLWLVFYVIRAPNTPNLHKPTSSHAVYLRDIETGLVHKSLTPPYVDTESYKLFMEARQAEYQWFDGRHYRAAVDIKAYREQMGMMRHDLLNSFNTLNIADAALLDNEYLNWLLDHRQRCRKQDQYRQNATALCDQVGLHIGTYF
ncbi:hypothetical protein BC940DRAFT_287440 [Gongronella butleri]|nr:hypothetical protein BC940DRAFT_287440 [Gongronella butleri]